MMNIQNPALYPPQQTYDYGVGMAQPPSMQAPYSNDLSQNQFQQSTPFSHTPTRTGQFPQSNSQIPPHIYQQLQQQQGFVRPQDQGNGLGIAQSQRQGPGNSQTSNPSRMTNPPINNNQGSNMALVGQMQQTMPNPMAQQAQGQAVINRTVQPISPHNPSREKARVTVLLEINAHLLQEVVSLQTQGKAGNIQQSPTSPNSTAENFNSPIEGNKAAPSKEYQECMRRLQANLSYLAAVADAKKRPDGKIPPYPAIINPPPHLSEVHELYKKLAHLFPEASQSATNRAIAFASTQHSQQAGDQGQMQPLQGSGST